MLGKEAAVILLYGIKQYAKFFWVRNMGVVFCFWSFEYKPKREEANLRENYFLYRHAPVVKNNAGSEIFLYGGMYR